MSEQKIFFLGASKMGTSSIHHSVKECGIRSIHSNRFGSYSHCRNPEAFFDQYQCFSDGSLQNIRNLKKWFPKAKFILLTRDYERWIRSHYHFTENAEHHHMEREKYLRLVKWIYNGEASQIRNLTDIMVYNKRVFKFFKGDANFMTMDVEADREEGWKRLSVFLGLDLKPKHKNIQKRKYPEKDRFREMVAEAESLASKISDEYPDIFSERSIQVDLYSFANKVIGKRFNDEKRIYKNMKSSIELAKTSPGAGIVKALFHIWNFIKVMFFVGLRRLIIPCRIASPFLW